MTTTEAERITIPARIKNPAVELVADLARVAGDVDAVFEKFNRTLFNTRPDDRMAVLAAALITTFSECISGPSNENRDPVPVDWAATTTEGESQ